MASGTALLYGPGVLMGLAALAVAQMGVHLVFFLHITTGADNTNNVLALAFGGLIVGLVIAGSVWIMFHLNANMSLPAGMMDLRDAEVAASEVNVVAVDADLVHRRGRVP